MDLYIYYSVYCTYSYFVSFLVFAKILYPHNTGLFIGENESHFGFIANVTVNSQPEILGYWFIPLVLIAMAVIYCNYHVSLSIKRTEIHLLNKGIFQE